MIVYKNLFGNNSKINVNDIVLIKGNVGVPLIKIVLNDSGENKNGRYIKFGNGWMICTMEVSVVQDINIAFGNEFISSGIVFPEYPSHFVSKPIISATIEAAGTANVDYISGGIGTATKPASIFPRCAQSKTSINIIANIIAYGRWK